MREAEPSPQVEDAESMRLNYRLCMNRMDHTGKIEPDARCV